MVSRALPPLAWPLPADAAAADRLLERFAATGPAQARLAARGAGLAMLRALGGNSPYLADLAVREFATPRLFARDGPDELVAAAMSALAELRPTLAREPLAAALRLAKRRIALTIALADIGGIWPLEKVTAALSALAEATLRASVAHLLRAGHDAGELRLPDPAHPETGAGFVVLGMGKLGAGELNYSSDVDLVLLHDPDSGVYVGAGAGAFFTRLSRGLVALMEARDAGGYVFRTDLRLRPDPAATPPSIALHAAIIYYESMGQNWERAAMIKARPVAGDLALGAAFLRAIQPFVWRRHLDFAAIADIHAMKRRIDAHKGTGLGAHPDPVERVAGHDVKLGEGGIREIEFWAQTQQLVWGGRDPALREPRTLPAIHLMARAGLVPRRAVTELSAAYRFLRSVEHRLQMVNDRQTHTLPKRRDQLDAFAVFMGFADARGFAETLLRHLTAVKIRYAELFHAVPEPPGKSVPALDFRGPDAPGETVTALRELGYQDPSSIISAVRGWQAGRVRALRSHRARDLMDSVLPAVLAALARQADPDAAFRRFDSFISQLPAGVQLLSLFQRNPALIERVAAVLGAARSLADHLSRTPSALEGLLAPGRPGDFAAALRVRLKAAAMLEDAIAVVREAVRAEDFELSVATMEGRVTADEAGLRRSGVADAALGALLPRVLADFSMRHGRVRGGGMVLVLLGKAGSREMMAGSDLDMMFIYHHPPGVAESAGPKSLPPSQWFIRAVQAMVAAITAPDAAGPTYAVDMRLRPSGNKGPLAVSLASFERYHAEDAWTWERMALTRARVVAGPPALRRRVIAAIRAAIRAAGPPGRIRADATAMRARLLRDAPASGAWDEKLRDGGQVEVEFIAQVLQLIHPTIAGQTTRGAFAALREAGVLDADDAALLIRADRVWRTVQGMLRITEGRDAPKDLPAASATALLRAASIALGVEVADVAALRETLDGLAAQVRAAFVRLVGPPTEH